MTGGSDVDQGVNWGGGGGRYRHGGRLTGQCTVYGSD